jgi:hypothetical protein
MKQPRRSLLRRLLRLLLWAGLLLAGIGLIISLVGIGWLRSPEGNNRLAEWAVPFLQPHTGSLELDSLKTDLFSYIKLNGVRIYDASGKLLLNIPEAEANYHLGSLIAGLVVVDLLKILQGEADLNCTSGCDIADIWVDPSLPAGPSSPLPVEIRVDSVLVEVQKLHLESPAGPIDGSNISLGGALTLWEKSVSLRSVRMDGTIMADPLVEQPLYLAFSGSLLNYDTLVIDRLETGFAGQEVVLIGTVGDLDGAPMAGITLEKIVLDPSRLPPDFQVVQGIFSGHGTLQGRLTSPGLSLVVDTPGGQVQLNGNVETETESWFISLGTESLSPNQLIPEAPPVSWAGTITSKGTGFSLDTLVGHTSILGKVSGVPEVGVLDIQAEAGLVFGEKPTLTLESGSIFGRGAEVELGGRFSLDQALSLESLGARLGRIRLMVDLAKLQQAKKIVGISPDLALALAPYLESLNSIPPLQGKLEYNGSLDLVSGTVEAIGNLDLRGFSAEELASLDRLQGPIQASLGTTTRVESSLELSRLILPSIDPEVLAETGSIHLQLGESSTWNVGLFKETSEVFASEGSFSGSTLQLARLSGKLPAGLGGYQLKGHGVAQVEEDSLKGLDARVEVQDAGGAPVGTLLAKGGLSLAGKQDFHMELQHLQVATLAAQLPVQGWSGETQLQLSLEGSRQIPRLSVSMDLDKLVIPGAVRQLGGKVAVVGERERLTIQGELWGPTGGLGTIFGDLPIRFFPDQWNRSATDIPTWLQQVFRHEGNLNLTVLVPPSQLPILAAVVDPALLGERVPPARLSASLALGGTLHKPTATWVSTIRGEAGSELIQADLDATIKDNKLVLDGTIWEKHAPRLRVEGGAPFALNQLAQTLLSGQLPDIGAAVGGLDISVISRSFPMSYLAKLVNQDLPIRGNLVGGLHIGGRWQSPLLDGALFVSDGRLGEVEIKPAVLTIAPAESNGLDVGYQLGLDAAFGEGTGLEIAAFVPVRLDPSHFGELDKMLQAPGLDVQIRGAGVPVALAGAFVPGFRKGAGTVQIQGAIKGSLAVPDPDLRLSLTGGRFALDATAVSYENLMVEARLQHKTAVLERFSVNTPAPSGEPDLTDSFLTAELAAGLGEDWFPTSIEGSASFKGFWVSALPDRSIRISGTPTLSVVGGKVLARGTIDLERANIKLKEDFFAEESDMLHPDILITGQERTGSEPNAGLAGMLAMIPTWLKVVMDVQLSDAIRGSVAMPLEARYGRLGREFSTVEVDGELSGEIRVEASHRSLNIVGQLAPKRGQARLLGRTFEIDDGTLAFTGRDVFSPLVDVTASYVTRNYGDMKVRIQGTPENPSLGFSSDSYGEEDVLAILLTGKPLSESPSDSGTSSSSLAFLALTSTLQGTLGRRGGNGVIERLQFDSNGIQGGFRVSRDVAIYTSYNYGREDGESPLEISVEWSLPNEWSLQFLTGGGNGQQISAWHTWKF